MDPDHLHTLYEDDSLLVVHKPSGMASHRGWSRDGPVALQTARDLCGVRLHLAHRLDRGTSGALVFTKSAAAVRTLCDAFEHGHVVKRYVGLCRGRLSHDARLDHPVPGTEGGPRVPAQTWIRCLAQPPSERCSVFEAMPLTGRLHQIRRHLKHLSHPIVGDVRYGDGRVNRHFRAAFELHRLTLHAWRVEFPHPETGRSVAVDAPLPPELAAVWTALELPGELATPGPWTEATADHNERRRPLPERTPPA